MTAVPRRLKRIEVHCPEYETTATIRINDAHSSGTDHLEVDYRSPDHGHFTIAIPDDWTDQDLLEGASNDSALVPSAMVSGRIGFVFRREGQHQTKARLRPFRGRSGATISSETAQP